MKKVIIPFFLLVWTFSVKSWTPFSQDPIGPPPSSGFHQVDASLAPELFVWTDTCNVYVLRKNDTALLIDLGDGSILDHLSEIGVNRVEWVLLTHHHREQCQGASRLKGSLTKFAAPAAEQDFFQQPQQFRKMKASLSDPFTVHGASFLRPPVEPVRLDRTFVKMDVFTWQGYEFLCLDTRGNSPGGMSYLLKGNGGWWSFSGDAMVEGAHMHTWFDTEWDYGFASGIYALCRSAALLESYDPAFLLPAHGPVIPKPKTQLHEFQEKLRHLERNLIRGYDVNTFAGSDQDRVSVPTAVPHVWQVSPHIFKFKGPDYWPNFSLILGREGHALVVDCGLIEPAFLNRALEGMQSRLGLKKIDAAIITHMHGDHFLEAPYLREKWGAQFWGLDRMAGPCEFPKQYDYAALIPAYGKDFDRIRFDRLFKSGETLDWGGYHFTIDWMPGQTEYALCLNGVIDGRKVAFTGDNIFGNPEDPRQTGHEAVVARNSAILEDGYLYAADYLARLQPDLIVGGHSWVMDHPAPMLQRFKDWASEMRSTFQSLSTEPDYRYWFDPFWVQAKPYRVTLHRGQSSELQLQVKNFEESKQSCQLSFHLPAGLRIEPVQISCELGKKQQTSFRVQLKAAEGAPLGIHIVGIDVTRDDRRYGELFDWIVNIE